MKRASLTLSSIFLLIYLGCTGKVSERFSFQPEYPQPGQEIVVTYNPSNTLLKDAEGITLLAYCFPQGMPVVKDVAMAKEDNHWRGSFTTDDTTLAVVIIFRSGELQDDNDRDGFQISMFNTDGKPIKGGLARQARIAYPEGGYPLRLNRDAQKAKQAYEKEFEEYPEQKKHLKILGGYWVVFLRTQGDSAAPVIKAELDNLAQKESKTVEELGFLANWYRNVHEKQLAQQYETALFEKEPEGSYAEEKRRQEIYREKSPDKKRQLLEAFSRDFPGNEYIESLQLNLISAYAQLGKYEEAEEYLDKNVKNPGSHILNSLAWDMLRQEVLLEKAVELAKKGVEKARLELEIDEKPGYLTQKEWQKNQERTLGYVLDTYAFGLFKLGEAETSVPLFEEAIQLTGKKNIDIQERYCYALIESGNIDRAFTELQSLLKENPSKANLRDLFKEIYIKHKGSEEGLEAFMAEVDEQHRQKKLAELKAQMMDKPAPTFTLNDLDGKAVSLDDYKGKIVILDFWATWCGPCVRSFPAMQQTVNKYASDGYVKFLFINTWERGENIDKKVKGFIQQHNYTFHVLRDTENSVVSAYKVQGIPTKFVIGPEGKLRFQSIGYHGDAELIKELDMLIELVR